MAVEFVLGGTIKFVAREVQEVRARVTLTMDRFTVTAWGDEMAYTLPADKQVRVKVSYVDANNNPAVVDGLVAWASSDPTIAAVTADPADSQEAMIVPGTNVGQCQITATADADLGEGTRPLVTLMDLTVVGGEAVAGIIEPVGAPTPKP